MKRFLITSSIFLIPIIIAAVFTEIALRSVPNPYKYKYEWMQKNAEDVETLVFGSSHAIYGIRPEFLDGNAFSLANVSQGTTHDLYYLKYWSDRYKNLKTVIVPISLFTLFSHGLEFGSESYRCRFYKIYMDCDLYSDWSLYNLELSDYRTAKGKLGTFFYNLFVKESGTGCDKYGWSDAYKLSGKNMKVWDDGSEADAAVKRHTAKSWDYIEDNYSRLKEIAEFCRDRHVKLILITTPCWHSYYDNLDSMQLTKMYEVIRKFQKEFSVPYFDYLKDKRFVADDFYDSNHLSDIGAEKFTKILNVDIMKKATNQQSYNNFKVHAGQSIE